MTIENLIHTSDLPLNETEILLANILQKDRSFVISFPETKLTTSQRNKFNQSKNRRLKNEPLAYILGYREFFGFNFLVNKKVLIPRAETENLVEEVLSYYKLPRPERPRYSSSSLHERADTPAAGSMYSQARIHPSAKSTGFSASEYKTSKNKALTLVDVGTGSGAIAISLALKQPDLTIIATDISPNALKVAKKNASLHKVANRIEFIESNLLENLDQKFDIITANLPYISTNAYAKLPKEIRLFEPKLALDSGKNSKTLYRKLFNQARNKLKPNGIIFYEINGDIFRLLAADLVEIPQG